MHTGTATAGREGCCEAVFTICRHTSASEGRAAGAVGQGDGGGRLRAVSTHFFCWFIFFEADIAPDAWGVPPE